MADPRSRLSDGLKNLTATPPPRTQAMPPPPPRATPKVEPEAGTPKSEGLAQRSGGEAPPEPAAKPRRIPRTNAKDAPVDDDIIGRPLGNKRSVVVYLPLSVRDSLDKRVADEGTTKGIVIMRTLRESHAELTKRAAAHTAPTDSNSPFPPERPARPRNDEKKVPTTFTLFPDEAVALTQVARDLTDGNVSALVTDALQTQL